MVDGHAIIGMCVQDHAAAFDLRGSLHLGTAGQRTLAVWLQAQAQAQAQNMAFQAHNLQAHAQQLEVESAHPVSTHMNVGLQHQVDQVHTAIPCSPPQALGPFVVNSCACLAELDILLVPPHRRMLLTLLHPMIVPLCPAAVTSCTCLLVPFC